MGDGGTSLGAWGGTEPTLELGTTTAAGCSCFEPVPLTSIRPSPETIPSAATTAAATSRFDPRDDRGSAAGFAVTVVGGKSSNFARSDRDPSSIAGSPSGLDAYATAMVAS
jgi:hypothetical protein